MSAIYNSIWLFAVVVVVCDVKRLCQLETSDALWERKNKSWVRLPAAVKTVIVAVKLLYIGDQDMTCDTTAACAIV